MLDTETDERPDQRGASPSPKTRTCSSRKRKAPRRTACSLGPHGVGSVIVVTRQAARQLQRARRRVRARREIARRAPHDPISGRQHAEVSHSSLKVGSQLGGRVTQDAVRQWFAAVGSCPITWFHDETTARNRSVS